LHIVKVNNFPVIYYILVLYYYKLYVPFSSINARKYFFSNGIIEPWNDLSPAAVDFSSLKRFKCTLKKIDFSPYLKYSCD